MPNPLQWLLPQLLAFASFLSLGKTFGDDLDMVFKGRNCIPASSLDSVYLQNGAVPELTMLDKDVSLSAVLDSSLENVTAPVRAEFEKSPTSRINELAQYNEISYSYDLVSHTGEAHKKYFVVELRLGDETHKGEGLSLKRAQRSAALLALQDTQYGHPPIKLPNENNVVITPTVLLNNIAAKLGFGVTYYLVTGEEVEDLSNTQIDGYGSIRTSYHEKLNGSSFEPRIPMEDPQPSGPFTVKVKVLDDEFFGFGHTIQAARHEAAMKAIGDMKRRITEKGQVCSSEDTEELCQQKKQELKSPISLLNEEAQKRNVPLKFDVISEEGKSHKRVFVTRCEFGELSTEAEGKSKKESKRFAAEGMLEKIADLPRVFTENEIVNGLQPKKKRKKRNKNLKMGGGLSAANLGDIFKDVMSFVWSSKPQEPQSDSNSNDRSGKQGPQQRLTPKGELLEVGNALNIDVQFTHIQRDSESYYSLVTLGTKPSYVCYGMSSSKERASSLASLKGLKFLFKTGLMNGIDVKYLDKDRFFYIMDTKQKLAEEQREQLRLAELDS